MTAKGKTIYGDKPASKVPPLGVRLPDDLKAWLAEQARRNGSSQNSEVIRALRAAMDRNTQPTA